MRAAAEWAENETDSVCRIEWKSCFCVPVAVSIGRFLCTIHQVVWWNTKGTSSCYSHCCQMYDWVTRLVVGRFLPENRTTWLLAVCHDQANELLTEFCKKFKWLGIDYCEFKPNNLYAVTVSLMKTRPCLINCK